MLGTGLQLARGSRAAASGDDRFYNPAKARRSHLLAADQLRRAQSDVSPSQPQPQPQPQPQQPSPGKPGLNRKTFAGPVPNPLSNLERFLYSITPSVPAQHFSKTGRPSDGDLGGSYFVLGDLWESFAEWSAYGAGVPLILNDTDSVVQYYVPYLSGIQIYCDPPSKLPSKTRQPDEDSDSDYRDSSSDGSSDCEQVALLSLSNDVSQRMDRLSVKDQPTALQEDVSSDDGENAKPNPVLIFEYFERDSPYGREPLADKILDLAIRVPQLKSLRSCDVLTSSWLSVAWYPIYRIPTGPTLKDLDACFLTYHSLSTAVGGAPCARPPVLKSRPSDTEGISKMSLPVFGLASYRFQGSLWTPSGCFELQLANALSRDADSWLRQLKVSHPDFIFFSRR